MRHAHLTAVACALVALRTTAASAGAAETVLAVVPSRSHASFVVQHLYVERVTGNVPIARGSVAFANGTLVPTHVEATLDPKHIDTHDGDRDDDLQGPDWFDVGKFPTWTFVSTSVVAGSGGAFALNGTFTAHGVGVPVTLDVTTVRAAPHALYHATGKLDRHAFGMRVTPLDGTIGGELDLTLDIELE